MYKASLAALFVAFVCSSASAQVTNPGVPYVGSPAANNDCAKFVVTGGNLSGMTTVGAACSSGGGGSPGGSTGNVQTNAGGGVFGGITNTQLTALINLATASLQGALPAWPNNTTTFFRGDGTYATLNFAAIGGTAAATQLPTVSASAQGAIPAWPNNTTTFFRGDGTYAALPAIPAGANPTATAGPTANNGSATTFMRSDASPAVQQATASQKGIVQNDNATICISSGVISVCNPFASPFYIAGVSGANINVESGSGFDFTNYSNTVGNVYVGLDPGGGVFSGSDTNAAVFGTASNTNANFATNDIVHARMLPNGAMDFFGGPVHFSGAPFASVNGASNGCAAADPTGATNSRAAIQCQLDFAASACTTMNALCGGLVWTDCGFYVITGGGITIKDGTFLVGPTRQCAWFEDATDEIAIQFSSANRGQDTQGLKNIAVFCGHASPTQNCVLVSGYAAGPGGVFENVYISGGYCALETNALSDWRFEDVYPIGAGPTSGSNGGGGCNLYSVDGGSHFDRLKADNTASIAYSIIEIAATSASGGGDKFSHSDSVSTCTNTNTSLASNVCVYVNKGASTQPFAPSWWGSEVDGLAVAAADIVTLEGGRVDGPMSAASGVQLTLVGNYGSSAVASGAGVVSCIANVNVSSCTHTTP